MDTKLRLLSLEQFHAGRFREQRQSQLENDLFHAIAHQKIVLHFQPQFEVDTGRGSGVEALARWSRLDGEDIPPSMFIPMAERIGMIGALGTLVLLRACETLAAWNDAGGPQPTLSVNVSARQINEEFCATIGQIIERSGFPGERLELEITESALITDTERTVACLHRWKQLGVQIAVDDFGTGYSSLSYLSRLPVDRLKLDKSFIERMTFEKGTAAIVRSMVALGKEMGIAVLAEGIETERQLLMLEAFGCRQVQGNLFARAVPEQEARALLGTPWGARSRGLHAA